MYKFNAPWHPLKKVCLGKSYPPEFYNDIKNSQVRDTLIKIAEETEQDYLKIESTLQELNVNVLRPTIKNKSIMEFVGQNGELNAENAKSCTLIPRPPMQPRDSQLIVDRCLIASNSEIKKFYLKGYEKSQIDFDAPYCTVIGRDIIVDKRDQPFLDPYIKKRFPDHTVTYVDIGGHNDAVYAPLKPGVILSTYHNTNYVNTFPNWEVFYIENQSWNAVKTWRALKHQNKGKWWLPGEEANKDFINFVNTWLTNWVGFVEETVFDVNCLMINDSTVLVNNYNRQVFEFFKKHKIEPIITPFRHRFFWDGGIHCITSDLYREGEPEVYIKR